MKTLLRIIAIFTVLVCLAAPASAQWIEPDEFAVRPIAGGIIFEHFNAEYNCCMAGVSHDVFISEGVIDITEIEIIGNPCWCLCGYSTAAVVENVQPGQYLVVFHWFEGAEWAQVELPVTVNSALRDDDPDVLSLWSECDGGSVAVDVVTFDALKTFYR